MQRKQKAQIKVEAIHSDFAVIMESLVLPVIIMQVPQETFETNEVKLPKVIQLADPTYD